MEQTTESLSPSDFRRFVKRLCILTKVHHDRELAKMKLRQQFQAVKTASLSQSPKRWVIEEEIRKLEAGIADVLAKEIEVLRLGREDSLLTRELKQKVSQLEVKLDDSRGYEGEGIREGNKKIEQLSNELSQMKERIIMLLADKEKKRIKPLKDKAMASRIKNVENRYLQMKYKGHIGGEDMKSIENKLSLLKNKV